MDWKMGYVNSNSSDNKGKVSKMPVWFIPVVYGSALLVAIVVVFVMCIRWHWNQQRSNTSQEEDDKEYQEISYKRSDTKKNRKDKDDDYEIIPAAIRKKEIKTRNVNKNTPEYRELDFTRVRPQQERQYAALDKATCASKTSLSSVTSGCDAMEDRSKNITKRRGIVIPSLSNPPGEVTSGPCVSQAQQLRTKSKKGKNYDEPLEEKKETTIRRQKSTRVVLTDQPIAEIKSKSIAHESEAGSCKPVAPPKPCWSSQRKDRNVRKIQYENAVVIIDEGQTKVERL